MPISKFHIVPLTPAHAEAICGWHYEPPYDFYNWGTWPDMQAQEREFGDPAIREQQYAAVLDQKGELAGFAQYFPLVGVTRLGLGMRPDRCGQGNGLPFVQAVLSEAARRMPSHEIDLEVHSWNLRAIRVYERAGFVIDDTYELPTPKGPAHVHCMTFKPTLR